MTVQRPAKNQTAVSVFRFLLRLLLLPFRVLAKLSKATLAVVFCISLFFNVGTLSSEWLNSHLSSVASKVFGTETVHSRQNAKIRNLEAGNRKLSSDLADADFRKRELRGKVLSQQKQIDTLNSERFVVYRGSKTSTRKAVSDTTERLAARVLFASKRNIATTFGEALPVVGIGVIVVATAWELADACMLMQDLHELNVAFDPGKSLQGNEVCGLRAPTVAEIVDKISDSPGAIWASMTGFYQDLPAEEGGQIEEAGVSWKASILGWFGEEVDKP